VIAGRFYYFSFYSAEFAFDVGIDIFKRQGIERVHQIFTVEFSYFQADSQDSAQLKQHKELSVTLLPGRFYFSSSMQNTSPCVSSENIKRI